MALRTVIGAARSAGAAYLRRRARRRRENAGVRARLVERRDYGHIPRETRARCWCGGALLPFARHPAFGRCDRCGGYVNRRPPAREHLADVYSLRAYWRRRQRLRGYPAIEERGELYRRDGRLDRWMALVERYGASRGRAVEVGCAPGVLLEELGGRGWECVGVEIDPEVAGWMAARLGLDVRGGFFPGVELPSCDLFLAFDVLEHSPCPDAFVREAASLLRPGGTAIVQTAIDRGGHGEPFGDRADLFDDLEHLFLFTDRAMELLAEQAGLDVVSLDDQIWVGGEIAVFRKPPA